MFRDDAMVQFEQWLHQQQQQAGDDHLWWSKVELRPVDDGSMGYGIFAREDIRLNETAIKVPERMMVTAGMVADIAEYAAILQRVSFDPAEVLALFFCFERVHCDCFCAQPTPNGPFSVQWALDIPPGFARFMKMRNKRQKSADEIWWRSYIGILPLRFGTPLFRHYLRGATGEVRLRRVADKLPQEAKSKLMGQLAELRKLERKLFALLYASQKTNFVDGILDKLFAKLPRGSMEFWREMCCWAWHVVNTRCIFVPDLPFHPLVDDRSLCAAAGDGNPRGQNKEREKRRPTRGRRAKNARGKGNGAEAAEEAQADGYGSGEDDDGDNYGGSLAIIPLVDMLNHSTDAQCVALFDHKHSRHYLVRADQHFVPAGRQLFVCYGAHDNARLWVEYGFRIENDATSGGNPFNRVPLPHDLFIALAERCGVRVSEKRREVLRKANLPCTIYATDEKPSFSLRKSCAILLLEQDKLQNWSQHIFGDDDDNFEGGEEGEGEGGGEEERDDGHHQHHHHQPNRRTSLQLQLVGAILAHLQKALEGRKANCVVVVENWQQNGGEERGERVEEEEEEEVEEEQGRGEEEEVETALKEGEEEEEDEIMASLWEDQVEIVRRMAQRLAHTDWGGKTAVDAQISLIN